MTSVKGKSNGATEKSGSVLFNAMRDALKGVDKLHDSTHGQFVRGMTVTRTLGYDDIRENNLD